MNGRKPSDKQIEFAKAIADRLGINEPDYTSYDMVCRFITDNKTNFNNVQDIEQYEKFPYDIDFSFSDKFKQIILDSENTNIIYFLYNNNILMYVGKSKTTQRVISSLKERIKESKITHVSIYHCETEADMHILELVCISFLKPPLNKDAKPKDNPILFTMPISLDKIKKIEIFEKTDKYEKHKKELLEGIGMSNELFNKIVKATGYKEQVVLRSLTTKGFVSDHLIKMALIDAEEGNI
jgi:hypothetical protein